MNRSPLKWVGGKYKLLPLLRQALPRGNRLIEPFVGAGSVFSNLEYPAYLIGDGNPDLIGFYTVLAGRKDLIPAIGDLFVVENNTPEAYARLRDEFNAGLDPARKAALFVYLNRHAFNGLCRYNARGRFNAPFGRYAQPYAPIRELIALRTVLTCRDITILNADYTETMACATAGDVVYCDPPYVPLSATANFTGYTAGGFGAVDQGNLAAMAERLRRDGVTVVISNADTDCTRSLYRYADEIVGLDVQRNISCNGAGRGKAKELIAVYRGSVGWKP